MSAKKKESSRPLKEITEFLKIQASPSKFRNLYYFRNLETIGGRQFVQNFSTLYIAETPLNSLQLRSFKTIGAGSVTVLENKELCITESIQLGKDNEFEIAWHLRIAK